MAHDFNKVIGRKGTDSMKWDATKERFGKDDLIPLWVADMDFKAPEEVIQALKEKVEHGVYGYPAPSADINETIVNWISNQYNWKIEPADIVHVTGSFQRLII